MLLKGCLRKLIDWEIDELAKFLNYVNIIPNKLCQPRSLKEDQTFVLVFFVEIPNDDTAKKALTQIKYINDFHVFIEVHQSKGYKQFYHCQSFNQSSLSCGLTPRCVKCGDDHWTRECPKPNDTAAKCFNISGDHPASYSKCPANPINTPFYQKKPIDSIINRHSRPTQPLITPPSNPNCCNKPPNIKGLFQNNSQNKPPLPSNTSDSINQLMNALSSPLSNISIENCRNNKYFQHCFSSEHQNT